MVLVSTAIAYPHPWHTRRSAHRQSGQHGGVNPNLRAHSPQTSNPPDPVYAFAQVTGPRHPNLMTAKTGPFSIPPPGMREGASDHVSARQRPSHALGGRGRIRTFEAHAMDLQSMGDKDVTSQNVPSIDNLRAYSPQIPDHSRLQPDTPASKLAVTASCHDVSSTPRIPCRHPLRWRHRSRRTPGVRGLHPAFPHRQVLHRPGPPQIPPARQTRPRHCPRRKRNLPADGHETRVMSSKTVTRTRDVAQGGALRP